MKSAYELALERLERQGIERPREDALSDTARHQIAEARQKAEAKLAELEILYRSRLKKSGGVVASPEEEEEYARERQRIEERRDLEVEKIRRQS